MKNKNLLLICSLSLLLSLGMTGCSNLIKAGINILKPTTESESAESEKESKPDSFSSDSDTHSSDPSSQSDDLSSESSIPNDEFIYSCTDLPDWIQNDGCVIFAWSWSPTDGGSWHDTYYTSANSVEFIVDNELTGFLLARCVSGTTKPDWTITSGNEPGRVYNQTEDINCHAGVYEYSCPEWKTYY